MREPSPAPGLPPGHVGPRHPRGCSFSPQRAPPTARSVETRPPAQTWGASSRARLAVPVEEEHAVHSRAGACV